LTARRSALFRQRSTTKERIPGRYLHDGALTSLEEMFDLARLKEDFVPTGFKPAGMKTHAVKGHEFGLKLPPEEKTALIFNTP
jgi:hypothetical protein